MKQNPFIGWVVTADQSASRRHADAVPAALVALAAVPTRLAFERTAGDEIQALLDDPAAVVAAVLALTRFDWHIGVGAGVVERPLPPSTREARGDAYVRARDAVDAAKAVAAGVALRGAGTVADTDAETALLLLATVAGQRTEAGWEVADLLERMSGRQAAAELGVTPSAVSQRAARAHVVEVRRASELAARLLIRTLEGER